MLWTYNVASFSGRPVFCQVQNCLCCSSPRFQAGVSFSKPVTSTAFCWEGPETEPGVSSIQNGCTATKLWTTSECMLEIMTWIQGNMSRRTSSEGDFNIPSFHCTPWALKSCSGEILRRHWGACAGCLHPNRADSLLHQISQHSGESLAAFSQGQQWAGDTHKKVLLQERPPICASLHLSLYVQMCPHFKISFHVQHSDIRRKAKTASSWFLTPVCAQRFVAVKSSANKNCTTYTIHGQPNPMLPMCRRWSVSLTATTASYWSWAGTGGTSRKGDIHSFLSQSGYRIPGESHLCQLFSQWHMDWHGG